MWADQAARALAVILDRQPEGILLVHGACPRGADAIAAYAARTPGYQIEAHPADWHRYGRAAGYRRNAEMIALGADGSAAFIRGESPDSTITVQLATTTIDKYVPEVTTRRVAVALLPGQE
jgi:hypothetical protein